MKKNNPIFKGFNSPATHQSHVLLNRGFTSFTWAAQQQQWLQTGSELYGACLKII